MLGAYRPLFSVPGAARLVVASIVGRTATAAIGLPLIFVAKDAAGSFAAGGAALGAYSAGVALAAPLRGRLVDRVGPRRSLPPLAIATALVLALMPLVAEASGWLLVPLGLVGGAAMPPLYAVTRGVWRRLLPDGDPRLERAYALEAVAHEAVYVVGPLAAGAGVATAGPRATLLAVAVVMVLASIAYALAAPPGVAGEHAGSRSPIRVAGVRVLLLVVLLTSVAFGVAEVAVPAFCDDRGTPGTAGVLLALWAGGGMLGGLVYGARAWPGSPVARFVVFGAAGVVVYALLPLPDSVFALGALLVFVGIPFATQFIALLRLLDDLVPRGADTETMTWMTLGNGVGIAIGSATGGVVVDAASTDAAFLAASALNACGLAAALLGRQTLNQPS